MVLTPWVNNDPTMPEKATYWIVDELTDLPCNIDPASLEQIDELLNSSQIKLLTLAPIHYMETEPKPERGGNEKWFKFIISKSGIVIEGIGRYRPPKEWQTAFINWRGKSFPTQRKKLM